ncbi:MAG: 16S rRNA (cytosine(1402)-N(4))-methyltransferase RsmH [Gammaproteobacteria bacterium]|nr:16S rRNA (cytosine(1402)-N(4))-methyltransferase RsmH [Gammaproteobacteria bacterium]
MSHVDFIHAPVLHTEVIEELAIRPDGYYLDGTYGRGGHARSILERLDGNGRLIVMDKDPEAIKSAQQALGNDHRVTIVHDDFANIGDQVNVLKLAEKIDGVLLDLGVSSPQLDDAARGFSFQHNGPLDMRMNPQQGESAAEWLNIADEKEIAKVLWELGEERFSRRIARKIVEARQQKPIEDTATLATLVAGCVPKRDLKKHPATRSFQAIRMHINRELEHINLALESIFSVLKVGGRLLVISFHSLEDRLVKRFLRSESSKPKVPRGLPLRESELLSNVRLKLIGKATKAGSAELAVNPRARSAVLRVAERTV